VRAFEKAGFVVSRQRGSHVILKQSGNRYHLSVPCHRGQMLNPGVLRGLIKNANMTVHAFRDLL